MLSCGSQNKCAQLATCSCKPARRARTSCDPGCQGNCRNTQSPSCCLCDLFEKQRSTAVNANNNSITVTPHNNDGNVAWTPSLNNPVLCGLVDNCNNAKPPASAAKQPPLDTKQCGYLDSSQESETAHPSGPSGKEKPVHNNNIEQKAQFWNG